MTTPGIDEDLRAAGLRVTRQRAAVLRAVRAGHHVEADRVITQVRGELGQVSTQAVYDVLRALVDGGLIRRIEPAGSPALYDQRVGDNHHHVVCRACGAVADVDCAIGHAPCLEASATGGFTIDEAEVTYWGLCPRCQTSAVPAGAAGQPSISGVLP